MLFLVMVHVKKYWGYIIALGLLGIIITIMKAVGVVLGLSGIIIIAKLMEVVGVGLKRLFHRPEKH